MNLLKKLMSDKRFRRKEQEAEEKSPRQESEVGVKDENINETYFVKDCYCCLDCPAKIRCRDCENCYCEKCCEILHEDNDNNYYITYVIILPKLVIES